MERAVYASSTGRARRNDCPHALATVACENATGGDGLIVGVSMNDKERRAHDCLQSFGRITRSVHPDAFAYDPDVFAPVVFDPLLRITRIELPCVVACIQAAEMGSATPELASVWWKR